MNFHWCNIFHHKFYVYHPHPYYIFFLVVCICIRLKNIKFFPFLWTFLKKSHFMMREREKKVFHLTVHSFLYFFVCASYGRCEAAVARTTNMMMMMSFPHYTISKLIKVTRLMPENSLFLSWTLSLSSSSTIWKIVEENEEEKSLSIKMLLLNMKKGMKKFKNSILFKNIFFIRNKKCHPMLIENREKFFNKLLPPTLLSI